MTHQAQEDSRDKGAPVELYKFTYGLGASDYYAYTDAERLINNTGVDYVPIPITRGVVKSGGGRSERRDVKVRVPAKEEMLNLFQIYPPDQPIGVLIRDGHFGDPDSEFLNTFNGIVINVRTRADGWGEILCRPLWTASQQGGLRRHYQIGCPHVLYGGGKGCGASRIAATVSATVGSIPSLNKVSLQAGWEGVFAPDKFVGGYVEWTSGSNTIRRTILSRATNVLTVSGPLLDLAALDPIDVVLGCNHEMDDCDTLHGVINDYGGQPWIPTNNPINTNPH